MDNFTLQNLNSSKQIAIGSFSIGTVLFALFWILKYFNVSGMIDNVIILGILYAIAALFVNTVVFIYVLSTLFKYPKAYAKILAYAGILLLNVPIAIGYSYLIISIN